MLVLPVALLGAASPAGARDDGADPPPLHAWFVRDSLIYPTTPDGWACHFLGQCRSPGVRTADDPRPIAVVPDGQNVELICQFGSYAKITTSSAPTSEPTPTTATAAPAPADTASPAQRPSTLPAPALPTPMTTSTPAGAVTTTSPTPSPSPRTTMTGSPATLAPVSSSSGPWGPASPDRSGPAAGAPLTSTGGPPEITDPVSGWPAEDLDTPTDLRPARCHVDQWAW